VSDENGIPVLITDNPNDLGAKFFVRLTSKQNIANVEGSGTVAPKTTSVINWLLIPAPGSAGATPLGKKYLVGATLKYRFGGEDTVLEVAPDVITVKPLSLLALDYFLTQDVVADDPLTANIEPSEPFTLGVRVKNNGLAAAKNLKIDSAQPKITENNQGLLINFTLIGSYVNDAPAQNTLFDPENKRTSGKLPEAKGNTGWMANNLVENQRYWWRVKAQDGKAESAWVVGNFLLNAVNDPPLTPTLKNPGNGAWSSVLQPTFEAHPVLDPEGEALYYRFEIYKDAKLTQPLGGGTSPSPARTVPFALADKTMYWWRVQAVDTHNAASPWSVQAAFTVSTGHYQNPSIALTTPATPVLPEVVADGSSSRKRIGLRWEGQDNNTEPTVALYYSTSASGYSGNLIILETAVGRIQVRCFWTPWQGENHSHSWLWRGFSTRSGCSKIVHLGA
jgi:hypothetical protein